MDSRHGRHGGSGGLELDDVTDETRREDPVKPFDLKREVEELAVIARPRW